jgi:hypothetical protein
MGLVFEKIPLNEAFLDAGGAAEQDGNSVFPRYPLSSTAISSAITPR